MGERKEGAGPRRYVRSQVPQDILNDAALNAAIAVLPSNYNFEIHKTVWRIRQAGATCVALQFPEGLLMYSLVIVDILESFAGVRHCFVLGDVTYGACCLDDFAASALGADLLVHYGHSCLLPVDHSLIPCLYVFVDIAIDLPHFITTVKFGLPAEYRLAIAGTIQFVSSIHVAKAELAQHFASVLVPQAKPLSPGEVLGCTAPSLPHGSVDAVVFVADGRFHLEAFMIANPEVKAFRYDPYLKILCMEEYDHTGMKAARQKAILEAVHGKHWGVVLGTLGRQGNPKVLNHIQKLLDSRNISYTIFLISEISPSKIALFEDTVDVWVQIACPRLSVDWGEAFSRPFLTPYEAEISLKSIHPWWNSEDTKELHCNCDGKQHFCKCHSYGHVSSEGSNEVTGSCMDVKEKAYPMDYYAQDGGSWSSSYLQKPQPRVQRSGK